MRRYFYLLLMPLFFAGCVKEKDDPGVTAARQEIYDFMKEHYLWSDRMPEIKISDFKNFQDLFDTLIYKPADKWSFISESLFYTSKEASVGFGFILKPDKNNKPAIATINSDADLYTKGVRRGWILVTVDGTMVAPLMSGDDASGLNKLIGTSYSGETKNFEFLKPDGTQVYITATSKSLTKKSLMVCDTLHLSSGIAGYLVFDDFSFFTNEVLDTTIDYLATSGINDLIVDLRYCSESSFAAIRYFSSVIAGNEHHGECWIKLLDNKSAFQDVNFLTTEHQLGIRRVVFITSGATSGYNEMMICGLKAYKSVTLVGSRTAGNPYYMESHAVFVNNESYYIGLWAVVAEARNKDGGAGFTNGIAADIEAADDLNHDFGDRREECLAAAISFLESN